MAGVAAGTGEPTGSPNAVLTPKFIGKCRITGCKHVVRVADSDTVREAWTKAGAWKALPGEERCPHHPSLVLNWKIVHGVHNPDKGCNERCMGATGPSCECECGGENHGGRWG